MKTDMQQLQEDLALWSSGVDPVEAFRRSLDGEVKPILRLIEQVMEFHS